jgi:hypothetical protein
MRRRRVWLFGLAILLLAGPGVHPGPVGWIGGLGYVVSAEQSRIDGGYDTPTPDGSTVLSNSQFTASDYVEVFEGDMPLLFAVGHGGWKEIGELTNGGYAADPLLRDYFYTVLAVRIYERTGHLPYVVYNQADRNYVNPNRQVGSSSAYHPDNTEARDVYFEFHNQVDAAIAQIEARFGSDMGLMINPHTTDLDAAVGGRPWDRMVDIGFIASVTNLSSSNNTMKALYDRKGEVALRGEHSIPYQLFHGQNWPTPDAVWPAAATVNSKTLAKSGDDVWHVLPAWVNGWGENNWVTAYYNGSPTISYHGTNAYGHNVNWSDGLDAFQMEVNYTKESGIALDASGGFQLDISLTAALMDDLIDAILHSLRVNYDWIPDSPHNVIVDNGGPGFSTSGPWSESSGQGFWGTPSVYSSEDGATATWMPNLSTAGIYEVLVRWTANESRADQAEYTVDSAGGLKTFTIDQSGGQDAKWVSLGEFEFIEGTYGRVVLKAPGGGSTCADAAMFRLVQDLDAIVVDNLDLGFSTAGTWIESDANREYGGSSLFSESAGSVAVWMPFLQEEGIYHVYAWWTYWPTRAQHAPYTINHAFGSATTRVNQRASAGRWQFLGTFGFRAGTASPQSVVLTREEGDGSSTSADAVRFIRVGGPLVDVIHLPLLASNP